MIFTAQITPREKQILILLAEEKTAKEIANELTPKISHRTVELYIQRLLYKTGCTKQTGLVRFAFEHKILTVEP